ncbi:hypothetical protein P5704_025260 (plasmid) [Pseudomonas sp. FeN3W]|nr:hypothetical protein P5704_025260 [Pseudomonas sp. FeN3W]
MRLFKYYDDDILDLLTLESANRIKSSLICSHDIKEDYLSRMLSGIIKQGFALEDIFDEANIYNPIELRTIAYLLICEVERGTKFGDERLHELVRRLYSIDHERTYDDREAIGDSLFDAGIAAAYWCFSINDPCAQRELSLMLYKDICYQELFITKQAGDGWDFNIQTFLPVSIRHLIFGKDQLMLLDRINYDPIDVPEELFEIVSEEFFGSHRTCQEDKLALALDAIEKEDGKRLDENFGMTTLELLKAWPMEYGRVQLILNNLSLEEIVDRSAQVAEIIIERNLSISPSEKHTLIEKFIMTMLLPFPEKLSKIYPGINLDELLDYPSEVESFFSSFYSVTTIMDNHSLCKGGAALINILDSAKIDYDADRLTPLVSKFPKILSTLLESEKDSSKLSSELLINWLQNGDHSNNNAYALNRVLSDYRRLSDPQQIHELNLYKVKNGYTPEYKINGLKQMMVKDLLEKKLLSIDSLIASALTKDDFKDVLQDLAPPVKRILIGAELQL